MRAGDKSSIFFVLLGWQRGLPPAPLGSWQPCPLVPGWPRPSQDGGTDGRAAGDQGPEGTVGWGLAPGQPAGRQDLPSSPCPCGRPGRERHFHFLALEKPPPSSGGARNMLRLSPSAARKAEPVVGFGEPSRTSRPREPGGEVLTPVSSSPGGLLPSSRTLPQLRPEASVTVSALRVTHLSSWHQRISKGMFQRAGARLNSLQDVPSSRRRGQQHRGTACPAACQALAPGVPRQVPLRAGHLLEDFPCEEAGGGI
nr:uncharacterized protein LOC105867292 isoform X3 [Microcebus murinus]XP_020143415.1 uncharacterized protein LOC105867292 isoform X3 [Microcebus murinus]